jgi:hypothetical protein
MRRLARLFVAMAALSAAAMMPTSAGAAGCYRLGETGYHWYRFCFGSCLSLPTPARLPAWLLLVPLERVKHRSRAPDSTRETSPPARCVVLVVNSYGLSKSSLAPRRMSPSPC